MPTSTFRLLLLALLALLVGSVDVHAQTYGFRASYVSGGTRVLRTFRMWVPPETPQVQGAVFLWAGSGQDWRDRTEWKDFQESARALGFALVGTMDNELGVTRAEVDEALRQILTTAAQASGHAELETAPVALMGFSQGGFRSALATALSSGRVIGMVGHKGAQTSPLTDEGKQAPVLFIAGALDGNFRPDFIRQVFQDWRNQGGRAAYAVDWGVGHEDLGNQGWEAAWYWLSEVVRLRVPEGAPGALPLRDIPFDDGWLGDKARFRSDGTVFVSSPYTGIAPVADYVGSADGASWLPSEGAAVMYRAYTSTDLAARDEVPLQTPLVVRSPAAFDTLAVGAEVVVRIDAREFAVGRTIQSFDLYDGEKALGPASPDATAGTWTRTYNPSAPGIHALVAVATDADGTRRTTFRTVVVKPVVATASASGPTPISGLVTLFPNRPNPFTRSTAIRFELATTAAVRLEVLDALGRTVATLWDAALVGGAHSVPFDAAGLPGGLYVARVTVAGAAVSRTILLLR